jgi:hypothetical protein
MGADESGLLDKKTIQDAAATVMAVAVVVGDY